MKYSVFKKACNDLGLNVYNYGELVIIKKGLHIAAHIHKFITYKFSIDYVTFRNLEEGERRKLLDLVVDYSTTELKDRED